MLYFFVFLCRFMFHEILNVIKIKQHSNFILSFHHFHLYLHSKYNHLTKMSLNHIHHILNFIFFNSSSIPLKFHHHNLHSSLKTLHRFYSKRNSKNQKKNSRKKCLRQTLFMNKLFDNKKNYGYEK